MEKMEKRAWMRGRESPERRKNRAPPPFGIGEKAYNIRKNANVGFDADGFRAVVAERRGERRVKRRKTAKNG